MAEEGVVHSNVWTKPKMQSSGSALLYDCQPNSKRWDPYVYDLGREGAQSLIFFSWFTAALNKYGC